ncbi:hypothetical protein HYX17_04495 [Candidatus Woesearchaeota archaeon]|nr:hypothetical protein [Candidatus Woesearchaeota archaeon]
MEKTWIKWNERDKYLTNESGIYFLAHFYGKSPEEFNSKDKRIFYIGKAGYLKGRLETFDRSINHKDKNKIKNIKHDGARKYRKKYGKNKINQLYVAIEFVADTLGDKEREYIKNFGDKKPELNIRRTNKK